MVKRPIHIRLMYDAVDAQKLLVSFQNMQIAYIESVFAQNSLSGDMLCRVIDAARKKLEARKQDG